MRDLDLDSRCITVTGKANKTGTVHFGTVAADILDQYLRLDNRHPSDPIFLSSRGERLAPNCLLLLVRRLGERAGLEQETRLFGSTLAQIGLGTTGVDGNNLAFWYQRADGNVGIALASPSTLSATSPEPDSLALLALTILPLVGELRRRVIR